MHHAYLTTASRGFSPRKTCGERDWMVNQLVWGKFVSTVLCGRGFAYEVLQYVKFTQLELEKKSHDKAILHFSYI